LLHTGHIRAL